MEYNIASVLKQLRKTSGYSANDVIKFLKDYQIDISSKTLYGYESGLSMPNANVFVALCSIYHCDNPMDLFSSNSLNYTEQNIVEKYRDLDYHGKEMVDFTLQKEWERSTAARSQIATFPSRELNAAHKDNPTADQKATADQIMEDDNEWT